MMKYISVGIVKEAGSEYILDVTRNGVSFTLTGESAALWLNGRQGFAVAEKPTERKTLDQLRRMGLVILADGSPAQEYRALTQCTPAPADRVHPYWGLTQEEKTMLKWLREAGLHLSMAELTYLIDRQIPLQPGLLGAENTQALVETIYTRETIFDNVLKGLMEHAADRDQVVKTLLALLKKKRIVLL